MRVVVDSLEAHRSRVTKQKFFDYREPKIAPVSGKTQETNDAARPLFLTAKDRRPTLDEQAKRRLFYNVCDEYLMLFKPLLPAFSLEHTRWCKFVNHRYVISDADKTRLAACIQPKPCALPEGSYGSAH